MDTLKRVRDMTRTYSQMHRAERSFKNYVVLGSSSFAVFYLQFICSFRIPICSETICPETTQKVTDAELLHQLERVDAQMEEGQRESEDCEDALYCKSLVPIIKALPLKKKRLAKIKISQLLFDLDFNE